MSRPDDLDYDIYAHLSTLEFFVEVFAANQLRDMGNAEEFMAQLRDRLDRAYRKDGGPIDAEIQQRMFDDTKLKGLNLANKIEARWREISGK